MDVKELARQYRERIDREEAAKPVRWAPKQEMDFKVHFGHTLKTRPYIEKEQV